MCLRRPLACYAAVSLARECERHWVLDNLDGRIVLEGGSVADVTDVAEEIAGQQGGFYDIFPALAKGAKGWPQHH
jgi:hypothetical protein